MSLGIKRSLFRILPEALRVPAWYRVQRWSGHAEPEMLRLREFVPRNLAALDVGANIGLYSYALSRLCPRVEAFEPQPECARVLRAFSRGRNVRLHESALSDAEGELTLHVPVIGGEAATGMASLRAEAAQNSDGAGVRRLQVPVRRLDSFGFTGLGFIKIDVEGHEIEVLRGAEETLAREKPVLLIEIEQRHLGFPMTDVFDWLRARGYAGFFLRGGRKVPLEEFSYAADQEPWLDDVRHERYSRIRGRYVNNFFFAPR
ncbi:MAG TPA: FkbM family methyltransferase [Fibrobacteria bacterium]|jgi:FkbM family methyltransferase|nr:FkbM family methyltransferase [Fibrobacteria bacterium]